MRPVHWLFIVSVGLFVSGIALVIDAERATQRAAPPAAAAATVAATPVASVRHIMNGILTPAAKAVFASVGIIVSAAGIEERQPRTDEEWEAVENSAAALSEGGNLLLMGRRAVDKENWAKISQDLIDAGQVAMKAAQAKDPDALLASGEAINASCDNCHQRYTRE
jgi:hypothetical protein